MRRRVRHLAIALLAGAVMLSVAGLAVSQGPLAPVEVTVAGVEERPLEASVWHRHRRDLKGDMAHRFATAIVVVTHDERIIPAFRRI